MNLSKAYYGRSLLSFRPLIFLGLIALLVMFSNAMDDPRESIENQRNSHSHSDVSLDEETLSDQAGNENDNPSQNSAFYENLAFCCGKTVSCYYCDDLLCQEKNSEGKWVDIPTSNHEYHPCVRHSCIWGSLSLFVVSSALLIGGSTSYAPACSKCCFPQYYSGGYTSCSPDCRLPFMSTVGSIDLATVLPACSTYSCYGCAGCCNKREFQRSFKEGQSCLPEHRFSLRNLYSLITKNPLINFCCGPTEDNSHKS